MPFTFFAHQAPVMGLASRHSVRIDGLALVVGTMVPDLAVAATGVSVGPLGADLHSELNHLLALPLLAGLASVLTLVVRHAVLPVAPLALPPQLRNLKDALLWSSTSRPAIWVTFLCALFGALTHVAIDSFTHIDGYVVERVEFFRRTWITVGPRELATYTLLQVGLSVVLGLWGLYAFWNWANRPRPGRDGVRLSALGRWLVWGCSAAAAALAVPVALARSRMQVIDGELVKIGFSVRPMIWCWLAFTGLLIGCLLARGQLRSEPVAPEPEPMRL